MVEKLHENMAHFVKFLTEIFVSRRIKKSFLIFPEILQHNSVATLVLGLHKSIRNNLYFKVQINGSSQDFSLIRCGISKITFCKEKNKTEDGRPNTFVAIC